MLRFDGRVAIITGAGRGLGRAYAEWLAARGASIVVNNRCRPGAPPAAKEVAAQINASGGRAVADETPADAPGAGEAIVARAIEAFGRLDIVIANAGTNAPGPSLETPPEVFREIMEVNFWGAANASLAALRHFDGTGYGRIVLTTSAAALFGQRGHAPYAAAKTALVGFARALAVELGSRDIRINIVSPYAYTNMSRHAIPPDLAALMAPEQVAPVVGALVHESCDRSGMVLGAGAGRVRRATMVEGPVAEMVEGPITALWPTLDRLDQVEVSRNSGRSALSLVPELAPPEGKRI